MVCPRFVERRSWNWPMSPAKTFETLRHRDAGHWKRAKQEPNCHVGDPGKRWRSFPTPSTSTNQVARLSPRSNRPRVTLR
jgi:hypothetical protein